MPIYEYECKSCHHHFELIQKITETPIKECPQCHEDSAVRLVSAAGFQLKGSGWYATDFKSKNKGPTKDQDKTAKPSDSNNKTTETKTSDTATTTSTKGEKE